MHSKVNYPPIKSKGDLDVELEQDMEDEQYLDILKEFNFLERFQF